jgi:protoporphyrin/coproporphyrin ferrochelatase
MVEHLSWLRGRFPLNCAQSSSATSPLHEGTFRQAGHLNDPTNAHDGAVAVVLFQLGGPDSPAAIEPFLYNLFSDPDIIDFPFSRLARPVLARLISSRRSQKVQAHYAQIGGKSPIRELTERQARALESQLRRTVDARVFVAMRYWHPMTDEAVRQVLARDFREVVLLPLYPQYSRTTTGSSLNEWGRRYRASAGKRLAPSRLVKEFYAHPPYLDAVVEKINEGLARFRGEEKGIAPPQDVHLVFSAHGVPLSVIEAGDPYQEQIEATVKLVLGRGGWCNPHCLCYQSRVGPGRWLRPMLHETLQEIATAGRKRVLVIPIAFVSDHVETLSEINIEARELAGRLGISRFEVMPALNDSPQFIRALAGLVLREAGARAPGLDNAVPSESTCR